MTVEATHELPDPAPFAAVAFMVPWAAMSWFLPEPYRLQAWGLLSLLTLLLMAASAWALRAAAERGLEPSEWAFATVVTFGFAMLVIIARSKRPHARSLTFVCVECGRRGGLRETFCYGCGAA